jgi:hypothetical protein
MSIVRDRKRVEGGLRPLVGRRVRIETDGLGSFEGKLTAVDYERASLRQDPGGFMSYVTLGRITDYEEVAA